MTPNEHDEPEQPAERPTTELDPYARVTPGGLDDAMPDVPVMEQLPDSQSLPDPGYPEMPASARGPAGDAAPSGPREPPSLDRGPADGPGARSWPRPPGPSPRPADPYAAPRAQAGLPPSLPPPHPQDWLPAATQRAAATKAGRPAQPPASETLTTDFRLPGRRGAPDGGWREAVYRATGGLVRVGQSPASMRRRDLVDRISTPVHRGHHRVAVLSLKGGVGKTTTTVGLGATLASLRGDRVIAVDGNPDRGTLSDKVHLQTTATIRDLLDRRAAVARYADVRAFTSQAPSRLEILASDRDPGASVAFSADDYRAVARVLERYYSICITDCGTGLLHSAMAGILELAGQIVLVSSPSVDGARSASATLDWLDAHGHGALVREAVVVLSPVRRKSKSKVDLDRLEQHFAARCRAVVRVPYDSHLEEGAEVELDYLDAETADAYLTLAALVADGFAAPS